MVVFGVGEVRRGIKMSESSQLVRVFIPDVNAQVSSDTLTL